MRFKKRVSGVWRWRRVCRWRVLRRPIRRRGTSSTCTAPVGDVTINTPPGNGTWTPGLVAVGNMVVKPYELHISGPFTPNDYPVHPIEYFTQDSVKNAPSNGRLAECTFSETFTDANGTGTSGGTAKVSYTKGKVHRRRARPDARDSTRSSRSHTARRARANRRSSAATAGAGPDCRARQQPSLRARQGRPHRFGRNLDRQDYVSCD